MQQSFTALFRSTILLPRILSHRIRKSENQSENRESGNSASLPPQSFCAGAYGFLAGAVKTSPRFETSSLGPSTTAQRSADSTWFVALPARRALCLDGARGFDGAFVRDIIAHPGVFRPVVLPPKPCELNAAAIPPRRSKSPPLSSAPSVPALFTGSQIRPVCCAARASAAAPIGLAAPVLLCT